MRIFKYTVLLASSLLIAYGDDHPVERQPAAQEYNSGNAESHWRGIEIRPESRCSPYDRSDYRYPQSLELVIIKELGRIYSPYTGRCFSGRGETDIEHIVALSEAHDSGLCAPVPNVAKLRRAFAADPLNLTLASPELNRGRKRHYDAAEWLPPYNQCWFAARIVEVRRKYGLTIDRREAAALDRVLATCSSTAMIGPADDCTGGTLPAQAPPAGTPLSLWDDNGNGRITCEEARRHGIAPVSRSHPAYPFMRDGDGDGVVCE